MNTSELIDALVHNVTPTRRLRPPLQRAATWLLLAAVLVALLGIAHGVRTNLAQQLDRPSYLIVLVGSLGTGVLAAVASFFVSLPDRSWRWALLPIPALLLWLASIGYQCLTHWVSIDAVGMRPGETARCFATLVLISLPLSLALWLMLRHAALLRPTGVALTGALAVAGFAATALWLFHPLDASAMVLAWNFGTMGLAAAAACIAARKRYAYPRGPM
jgi:hypothetical protein